MSEYVELILRWAFGLQMIFWGLNGFFNWIKIPPASPVIEQFLAASSETRFIMPSVKIIEILFGAFLLLNFAVPLSLAVFSPIIFIITGLHVFHNSKPWSIVICYTLPYSILLFIHSAPLLRLVH